VSLNGCAGSSPAFGTKESRSVMDDFYYVHIFLNMYFI
jgi:hypothetical protein